MGDAYGPIKRLSQRASAVLSGRPSHVTSVVLNGRLSHVSRATAPVVVTTVVPVGTRPSMNSQAGARLSAAYVAKSQRNSTRQGLDSLASKLRQNDDGLDVSQCSRYHKTGSRHSSNNHKRD